MLGRLNASFTWPGRNYFDVVVELFELFLNFSAESGYEIACRRSVCRLSVTFRYRAHIGWNSSKIISRPNSLRPMRSLTPNMGDLVQREHPQN